MTAVLETTGLGKLHGEGAAAVTALAVHEHLAGASEARRARLRRSEVGFVFQFFNLIANLTVADNVELPALLAPGEVAGNARWSTARACCSRTSRPATSTPPPRARSSPCCASVTPTARRSSS